MRRIDAFNHFFPAGYYKKMEEVAGDLKDMFRRTRAVQSIHDLDTRLRVVEQFPDYAQNLSRPAPTLERMNKGRPELAAELAKIGNDGLAELVARHPKHFPAFIAQVPLSAPDAGAAEAERAIKDLGAVGVQIYGLGQSPDNRHVGLRFPINFSRPVLTREVMVRHGDAATPIWASEYSWIAVPPDWTGRESTWGRSVSEPRRGDEGEGTSSARFDCTPGSW